MVTQILQLKRKGALSNMNKRFINILYIVPNEGETVEQAFDRQYPNPTFPCYVVECKWIKTTPDEKEA